MAADQPSSSGSPQRAPWVEPAPRPIGMILFWGAMAVLVIAMISVIAVVGVEDESAVRPSIPETTTPTTVVTVDLASDLDVLLTLLGVPADDLDLARSGNVEDTTGDVTAVDHVGEGTSPPDSAGRVDLIDHGSYRYDADDDHAALFEDAGLLACGALGTEATTDWSVECLDQTPGAGLATAGPVLVVWGGTRLILAEPDSSPRLCVATVPDAIESAVVVEESNVVRTLELQVRGGVDVRSIRALHVGNLWAFVVPVSAAAPTWRLSGTQVTVGAVSTDDVDPQGPPPAPPRAEECAGDTIAPSDLVIPTTTTTIPPATTTTTPPATTEAPTTTEGGSTTTATPATTVAGG